MHHAPWLGERSQRTAATLAMNQPSPSATFPVSVSVILASCMRATYAGPVSRDGRYAPSPTGLLHLGNLRTALLAWLFARSAAARFVMRIEDLDRGRSRPHFERAQLDDLEAIGLDWDGEVVRQSERHALYERAIARLDAAGLLYPCFCTRAEIREATTAPHGPLPEGAYPGTCRRLTAAQRAEREAGGRPPALRLDAGAARIRFTDRLTGQHKSVVDDLVV